LLARRLRRVEGVEERRAALAVVVEHGQLHGGGEEDVAVDFLAVAVEAAGLAVREEKLAREVEGEDLGRCLAQVLLEVDRDVAPVAADGALEAGVPGHQRVLRVWFRRAAPWR